MNNCICKNIKNWDGKQVACDLGNNFWLGFNLCNAHQEVINNGEITLSRIIEEAKTISGSKYYKDETIPKTNTGS